jgi:hypothetical protein
LFRLTAPATQSIKNESQTVHRDGKMSIAAGNFNLMACRLVVDDLIKSRQKAISSFNST